MRIWAAGRAIRAPPNAASSCCIRWRGVRAAARSRASVLIQTRNPDDPVMRALAQGSRDAFLEEEMTLREQSRIPPFGRFASLILAGADAIRVRETGRELALTAPKAGGVAVWGPAPAFYQVLRGRTRERLLVQAEKNVDIQAYFAQLARARENPVERAPHRRHRPDQLFLSRADIGLSEIIADIEQRRIQRLRRRVRKTVAAIQSGRMPPLAVIDERLRRQFRLGNVDGNGFNFERLQQRVHSLYRLRKHARRDHHGLDARDRRNDPRSRRFDLGDEMGFCRLLTKNRDECRGVDNDHFGRPCSS